MIVGKQIGIILTLLLWVQTQVPTPVVLFFGDSLTAGYGLSPEEAFPALIEKNLVKAGRKIKVVNAGLSGETSAGGLARIDWILRQRVDVFVLELGANDGLRGLPLAQTRANLQGIIDKVKQKYPGVKIVMAGMQVPPNMGTAYAQEFQKIYPDLAKQNQATLIPFLLENVAGIEKLNQADGIHPNAEGHKRVAEHVGRFLEKVI
ncbi:MAG: arylesterase [Cyclobacteriaceae bacterium]|jgi:acyl-CoA thioesterase-1|nr:arylesterase [Cyclobacteriaceae bacterium]